MDSESPNSGDSSLDSALNSLVAAMPEPRPNAIAEAMANAEQGTEGKPNADVELDALGVPFDARIHATGRDGRGVRAKSGAWRNRRGTKGSASILRDGRGSAAGHDGTAREGVADNPVGTTSGADAVVARKTGEMFAAMFINVCVAVGGEEWKLRRDPIDEHSLLFGAFGDYAVAKNMTELSPSWALLFAVGNYSLPRFTMPTTKSRAQRAWLWMKTKVGGWMLRRRGGKAERQVRQEKPAEKETGEAGHEGLAQ